MVRVIARKYTKALLSVSSNEKLPIYYDFFKSLGLAFKEAKFRTMILGTEIDKKTKAAKVCEIFNVTDPILINSVRLLAVNKKLELASYIAEEIRLTIARNENCAEGRIITSGSISQDDVAQIETLLSKKLGKKITLHVEKGNFSGVQVEIPDLGIETELSIDKLKAQVVDHILKAF